MIAVIAVGVVFAPGKRSQRAPYTHPSNVLAGLVPPLGHRSPAQTLPARDGRPMQILDESEPIAELS